ncbi:MAG: glycoside hydrolase, partial [Planctomycetota bacterium]|nr:glycoside hydrolase [Planctomycetota bacterium]
MINHERCLLVHGHFYQPPRENPWSGRVEPQSSALPWEDWNHRIADECYLPMARSRIRDSRGSITDLCNNYARASFNFGPTLMAWLEDRRPRIIRRLRDAAGLGRSRQRRLTIPTLGVHFRAELRETSHIAQPAARDRK